MKIPGLKFFRRKLLGIFKDFIGIVPLDTVFH